MTYETEDLIMKIVLGLLLVASITVLGFAFYDRYYDWKHDCHCLKSHKKTIFMYNAALKMSLPQIITVCDDKVCNK